MRRGRRRVVDVRQDVVVPPLLFRPVRVVTIGRRGSCEMTICDETEETDIDILDIKSLKDFFYNPHTQSCSMADLNWMFKANQYLV